MANLSNINGKFVVEQTTGYVGVGTTDPNYPIEVLNASAEIALNASGGSIYILRSDSTDSFRIIKNDVGDKLVIDSSGNSTFTGSVTANTGSKITSSSADTTFSIETTSGTTIFPILDFVSSHSTAGTRIRVNGTDVISIDKSQNATFAGNITVGDLKKIILGNSSDLEIYHDGSDSYIDAGGQGDLRIDTSKLRIRNAAGTETMIIASENGSVELYHNDVKKLQTTSSGVTVTGVFGAPSSSGSGDEGILRLSQPSGIGSMYMGFGDPYAWIQSRSSSNFSLNYNLALNPLGGDVGIGTVSPNQKITIGFADNGTDGISFRSTTYASLGKILCENDNASTNGNLQFYTRSGGDVLERMRIRSNGAVGIGIDNTTNSNVKLRVVGNLANEWTAEVKSTNTTGQAYGLVVNTLTSAGVYNLGCYTHTGNGFFVRNDGKVGIGTGTPTGLLTLQRPSSGASTDIDFLNEVGAGPKAKIRFGGTIEELAFFTGVPLTERMRIDSSGNVGIGGSPNNFTNQKSLTINGISGGNSRLDFQINGTNEAEIVANDASLIIAHNDILKFYTASTERLIINSAGYLKSPQTYNLLTATAANMHVDTHGFFYRSTSSLKYKTDVKDYDKGLNEVMQLQPKYYKGINDGDTQFAGLIAEDVHNLGLTEFVQYADDGSPDALSYSHMIALLTKSIQELKADNDSLKARIETLENN